jgi:hypothetical protein
MGTIAYFYSNVAVPDTVGGSGVSSTDTLLTAGSLAPTGYPQQIPFKLRLDPRTPSEEIVKVTGGSGTVAQPWVIVRGWDGTLATGHDAGAAVEHGMSAEDLFLSREHEAADSTGTYVGGVLNTSLLPHGLPAAAWLPNALNLIQQIVTPAGTTSTVTFSAIPQIFTHLLLVVQAKTSDSSSRDTNLQVQVNGDATGHYATLSNYVTDGSPSGAASEAFSQTSMSPMVIGSSALPATATGGGFAFFPFYTSANYNKTAFGISGSASATSNVNYSLRVRGAFYRAATPITSMTMFPGAGRFMGGSLLSLYGLQ